MFIIILILIILLLYLLYKYYKTPDNNINNEPIMNINGPIINGVKSYEVFDDVIKHYPNFLTPTECNTIIELSKNRMTPSSLYGSGINTNVRKSDTCWLQNDVHPVVKKISNLASEITNTPLENQEYLQIVHYTEGGFFKEHYDACFEPEYRTCREQIYNKRYATILIYLNDDYEGGGTYFPYLNYTTTPKKGDAILFYDTDENQNKITNSKHQANSIIRGEKWVCNKWVRHFPFF
jgi:prolyl 4-hydroxylase